jgi:hypothetical protein
MIVIGARKEKKKWHIPTVYDTSVCCSEKYYGLFGADKAY